MRTDNDRYTYTLTMKDGAWVYYIHDTTHKDFDSFPECFGDVVETITVTEAEMEALDPPRKFRDSWERWIGYRPDQSAAPPFNLVEMMTAGSEDDGGFCQPCAHGHLVTGHAVYCHNQTWLYAPRKCRRTWYTGGETRDEDCEGYSPNAAYKPPSQRVER